jgi:hypothetical protein
VFVKANKSYGQLQRHLLSELQKLLRLQEVLRYRPLDKKVVKKFSCLFTKFVPVHLIEMLHVFVKNKSLLFFHKEKKLV